jgi:hypothetical protein
MESLDFMECLWVHKGHILVSCDFLASARMYEQLSDHRSLSIEPNSKHAETWHIVRIE